MVITYMITDQQCDAVVIINILHTSHVLSVLRIIRSAKLHQRSDY